MIVSNFNTACVDYENFAIWEIKSMNEFLTGNGVFEEIFKTDYKMDISEFSERRSEIEQNDMQIIKNMLDQVGDKHFVIFTHHDPEHIEWSLQSSQFGCHNQNDGLQIDMPALFLLSARQRLHR